MAGHSHWAQIKHKKGPADAKRGQLFSKLVKEITVAARDGGPNPDANARLRGAVERAREAGMPKDNIERALARASGRGEDAALSEFLYEASAPGGVALLIEGITDNKNRSLAEIKHLLAAHGARLAEPGSLVWNFDKVGILTASPPAGMAPNEVELAIIDAGVADAREEQGVWIVEMPLADRAAVLKRLVAAGFTITGDAHDYKPRHMIASQDPAAGASPELIATLLDHDDVQDVYTNARN